MATTPEKKEPEVSSEIMAALGFSSIWYAELMKNYLYGGTKGDYNPFTDGIVSKILNTKKAKVKLRNGTEVNADTGMFSNVKVKAYVLLLKHFRKIGMIATGLPNYNVGSYEIIGVRYINSDGTLTKVYRN